MGGKGRDECGVLGINRNDDPSNESRRTVSLYGGEFDTIRDPTKCGVRGINQVYEVLLTAEVHLRDGHLMYSKYGNTDAGDVLKKSNGVVRITHTKTHLQPAPMAGGPASPNIETMTNHS